MIQYFNDKPGDISLFIDASILKVLSFVLGDRFGEELKKDMSNKFVLRGSRDKKVDQPKNPTVVFAVRPDREVIEQIAYQA